MIGAMDNRTDIPCSDRTADLKWLAVRYHLRAAFILLGIFLLPTAGIVTLAEAQESQVLRELQRLGKDLRDLQQYIYRGTAGAGTRTVTAKASGRDAEISSRTLLQIQGIDRQLRQLTGKLEELEYSIGALASRLDRLVGDVDLRLQTLESSMQMVLARPPAAAPQGSQPRVFALPPTQPVQQVPLQQSQVPAQAQAGGVLGTGTTGLFTPSVGSVQIGTTQATTIISSAGATGAVNQQQVVPAGQASGLLPGQKSLGTVTGSQFAATQTDTGVLGQGSGTLTLAPVQRRSRLVPKAGQVRPLSLEQAVQPATKPKVIQQASAPAILPPGTPKQRYDYAFSLLQKRDFDTAERAFRAFIEQHPQDTYVGNAYYWLGETLYVRKQHAAAAQIFSDGYTRFPNGPKAPDNLLKLGKSLVAVGETAAACKTFSVLLEKFPNANTRILENAKGEFGRASCK